MGWNGQEGSVWIRRGEDPSAVATPLGDASGGSEASELLIDFTDQTVTIGGGVVLVLGSHARVPGSNPGGSGYFLSSYH